MIGIRMGERTITVITVTSLKIKTGGRTKS